jgi:hypothetical protein
MGINWAGIPERLLAIAVRRMPVERREWGAAMLAELAILQHPVMRWRFALDCARVALFPPHQGGFMINIRTRRLIVTCGTAAIIGLILAAPPALLEIYNNPGVTRNLWKLPIGLFALLWLLPTAFSLTVIPIARGHRAGESILARPVALSLRVIFLALISWFWALLVIDQMPCFLGAPNCD